MQPAGHHLAEFNMGVLRYDWEDPRVKGFFDGLDLVNGIAQRSSGFVWMLGDDDMGREQSDPGGALGGNPRTASTLSVWKDASSLENFVWNTVHKQFYDRRAEWYDAVDHVRLVMWWVPVGHRPSVAEAMQRLRLLEETGDSDEAFGWSGLRDASLWKTRQCGEAA